jgi:PAS domain S-box-containing protein
MNDHSTAEGEERGSSDRKQASNETVQSVELTPNEYAELLDPKSWDSILALYAHTMRLAVALVDPQGNLLGKCHNPQPIWSLARATAIPDWGCGCLFCLERGGSCTAATDALRMDSVALAHDRAGFVHIASPLSLGGLHVGTLLAGQVFDRFPEPLPLKRLAKDFGLSASRVWQLASQQAPIGRTHVKVYGDLLNTLGQAFLGERYSSLLERRLAETNQRFRLLADGVKDYAVFTVDTAGVVSSWNAGAQRMLGYTESEIRGRHFCSIFVPEDIEKGLPQRDLQTVAREGRAMNERWYSRKDGTQLFVSGTLAAMGQREVREFGMIMHDITHRLNAEDALLQKQKLESLGVLAGGVAHDFNNLLTSILGNASLLLETISEFDRRRSNLETIISESQRAAVLTSQLLAYSGEGRFEVTEFDLSQLISGMLPLVETAIPKAVRLKLALASGLPRIEADATQIRQIVMNLVINGAEAIGPEGGTLWVSTGLATSEPRGARLVYIEVRDSGCGMDEAMQSKIFDPFFTTKFMGRGLGLAAVTGIVRVHKGAMRVLSNPGKGTTFRITLPSIRDVSPESEAGTLE